MRIQNVKISGYKAIPFCAKFIEEDEQVEWDKNAFEFNLSANPPYIYSIIGPNSCGKSSIFLALDCFFNSKTRITDEEMYYEKKSDKPIIIEITLIGPFNGPEEWRREFCECVGSDYVLNLISVFTTSENQKQYIKKPNGELKKVSPSKDKPLIDTIQPQFRLIPSDCRLNEQVNPEKKNFTKDLITDLVDKASSTSNRSALNKIDKAIQNLKNLVIRENESPSGTWKEIESLESLLSENLSGFTPGNPTVKFSISDSIPSMEDIFLKGRFRIVDGVEVDFEKHGLGMQRIFLISILESWASIIAHQIDKKDYVFAIEEPELFLHPHAIRSLLNTLMKISEKDQVLFSTHSGDFVNSVPLEKVIKIRRVENRRTIISPTFLTYPRKDLIKIQRYLREEKSDMLFARAVLLVEGQSEYSAIPGFARTLGIDFDHFGISTVFVNGKGNFSTYHQILKEFKIPHFIFGDGDGNKSQREIEFGRLSDGYEVLEFDFEYLIASKINRERILTIVNKCRSYQDLPMNRKLEGGYISAAKLRKLWSDKLKEDIFSDIDKEYVDNYRKELAEIKKYLLKIGENAITERHLLPSHDINKYSSILKKQGKPLVGRVLAEELNINEVNSIVPIVNAINQTVNLSQTEVK